MHPDDPDRRRTVTADDVGKDVVTCYGAFVGTVAEVNERDRRFRLDVADEAAELLDPAAAEFDRAGSTVELRPEHVEMVTADRVWLRI